MQQGIERESTGLRILTYWGLNPVLAFTSLAFTLHFEQSNLPTHALISTFVQRG